MPTKWQVNKAVRASSLPAPSRLIMLTLSDIAEAGTAEVPEKFTPSLTVLARETGLGRSTVIEHLGRLEEAGWIDRVRPDVAAARLLGERTSYKLMIPPGAAPWSSVAPLLDYPVQEPDSGSPGDGLDLVQEPDSGSPGDGPNNRPVPERSDLLSAPAAQPPADKATKRGERLPADWNVTPKLVEWAVRECPLVDGRRETQRFKDHWDAETGVRATKRNWDAAWRNWMRKAQEIAEDRRRRAQPRASPQAARLPASYHQTFVPED